MSRALYIFRLFGDDVSGLVELDVYIYRLFGDDVSGLVESDVYIYYKGCLVMMYLV